MGEREGFYLTDTEIHALDIYHKSISDRRDADKIKAIILLAKGWTYATIEEALRLDERTIARYRKLYLQGGIEKLLAFNYQGGIFKLTAGQMKMLQDHLDNSLYASAAEICEYVKKTFNVTYKPQSMVKLLKKLGYVYKKTKAVPGKADRAKQEAFVEAYKELGKSISGNEKIVFCDTVHPTYNMMPGYAWIKKGDERFLKSNEGRKHLNLVGAYCPQDHSILVRDYATISADSIVDFFKALEKKYPDTREIHVILDNAPYHHANIVDEYLKESRIKLMWLPPYSPNLNLIERLWKMFKKNVLYNKYYPTFEDFKTASCRYFTQRSGLFKKKLASLLTEHFQLFPIPA